MGLVVDRPSREMWLKPSAKVKVRILEAGKEFFVQNTNYLHPSTGNPVSCLPTAASLSHPPPSSPSLPLPAPSSPPPPPCQSHNPLL